MHLRKPNSYMYQYYHFMILFFMSQTEINLQCSNGWCITELYYPRSIANMALTEAPYVGTWNAYGSVLGRCRDSLCRFSAYDFVLCMWIYTSNTSNSRTSYQKQRIAKKFTFYYGCQCQIALVVRLLFTELVDYNV